MKAKVRSEEHVSRQFQVLLWIFVVFLSLRRGKNHEGRKMRKARPVSFSDAEIVAERRDPTLRPTGEYRIDRPER